MQKTKRHTNSSKSTLPERIINLIRNDIVRGKLKGGQRISEIEMARQYNVSRTPIREALRNLTAEGFVFFTPRRGAVIAHLTQNDVFEFYELKAVLEGFAARLATEKLEEKDLGKLEKLNNEMEKLHEKGELNRIARVHTAFHNLFVRECGNNQLYLTLKQLSNKFQRFTILLALAGKNPEAVDQHREIIKAFRLRNADLAEKLVRENALLGKELMIKDVLQFAA